MDHRRKKYTCQLNWLLVLVFVHLVLSQEDLCKPSFGYEKFEVINEDTEIGTVILTLNTTGSSAQVNLTLEDNDNFAFNTTTQELTVKRELDVDAGASNIDKLNIVCKEPDKQPVKISVTVSVRDVNDNPPRFTQDHFYVDISETMSVEQTFDTKMKAIDADSSLRNQVVYYTVAEGTYSDYFQFTDEVNPYLMLRKSLDFETLPNMTITVVATNGLSFNKLNSTALLTIRVIDEDDLNPVFSSPLYEGTVLETARVNTLVNVTPVIMAVDADVTLNEPVIYSFHAVPTIGKWKRNPQGSQNSFLIDNETGEIRLAGAITPSRVSIVVQAAQRDNPSRYGVAMIVITVVGVNSNAPKFQQDVYKAFVSEAVPVGTINLFVSATDQDFGASVRYDIVENNTSFAIDADSGAISVASPLDYEKAPSHTFTVKAFDGNMESTAAVEVTVVDANDNSPVIPDQQFTFDTERDNTNIITQIQAYDVDAWTLLEYRLASFKSLFSIDNSGNLRISAKPDELTESEYFLVIVVADNGTSPRETCAFVTVRFPPLTTPSLPPATTKTTSSVHVAMSGASNDILAISLGAVAALLLIVVIVLLIFLCRRRNQTSEQLDKAKINRSPDPRGLKFKNANRGSHLNRLHFPEDDSLDSPTTVQENPLSLKQGGAFNHAFVYSDDLENDRTMDEIHVETAVIPYQAADAYNNNTATSPNQSAEMYQHDSSSEYGDTLSLPPHKRGLINGLYPENTSSESLNTSRSNSSREGAKQLLIGNGVTSFGTASFDKNAAEMEREGDADPTLPVISVEALNPDLSVAPPQEQKSELTVYF